MGEEKNRVYFSGCPGMDLLSSCEKKKLAKIFLIM